MQHLFSIQKPKILLVNFTEEEAQVIVDKKYNAERGWAINDAHFFPSPGYEYDVVFAKFDEQGYESARKLSQYGANNDDYDDFQAKLPEKAFAVVFSSEKEDSDFSCAGITDVEPMTIDDRNKEVIISPSLKENVPIKGLSFTRSLIEKYKEDIIIPIPYGIKKKRTSDREPYYELLTNEKGEILSLIQFTKHEDYDDKGYRFVKELTPNFLVLPPIPKKYERVVVEILSQLPSWRPELFPKSENYEWITNEQYISQEIKDVQQKIEEEIEDHRQRLLELEKERSVVEEKDSYLRQLLIADDSDEFLEEENLTSSVARALTFLGFEAEIKEKTAEKGRRREDIVCKDDDYQALVECKGTISQNPPEKYHSQLQNHLLASVDQGIRKGILIINHDRKNDAFKRLPLYDDEATAHLWKETENVSILSTIELFKIIRAVQKDELEKSNARDLIKKPGRVQYQINKVSPEEKSTSD